MSSPHTGSDDDQPEHQPAAVSARMSLFESESEGEQDSPQILPREPPANPPEQLLNPSICGDGTTALNPASDAAAAQATSNPKRSPRFHAIGAASPKLSHKPHGLIYFLIRWPILLFVGLIILLEIICYAAIRWIVASYELASKSRSQKPLRLAKSYEEWTATATEIDKRRGNEAWKEIDEDPFYDSELVFSLVESLHTQMKKKDPRGVVRVLMEGCKNNLGGIENEQLYSQSYVGTKHLVEEYVSTTTEALDFVASDPSNTLNKSEIFRKLGKSYGRTALCLSGGASFGYYHLGVVKCLLENGVLPKVISGTSAGALISSFICVRSDAELKELLNPHLHERFKANDEGILTVLIRFLSEGALFDLKRWEKKLQKHITKGSTTFLEAFEATGRILNISVASEEKFSPPMILNYKTTPNVVIWSAVLASAAVPGFLHAVELKAKKPDGTLESYRLGGRRWRDGVLKADIPYTGLKQLFGVSYTIVSQVNPHVIPFFYQNRGSGGSPTLHRSGRGWRGGFLASMFEDFLRLDMRKWVQLLHNLNLLPRVLGQDWSMVFLQNFAGNVTIVPDFRIPDYFHIIFDPSYETMKHFITKGEANTWPKISMIANRLKIEQKLEQLREKYPVEGRDLFSRSSSALDLTSFN